GQADGEAHEESGQRHIEIDVHRSERLTLGKYFYWNGVDGRNAARLPSIGNNPYRARRASGSAARAFTESGSDPDARSASVTVSNTARRFARTAIHTSWSDPAGPGYSISSGRDSWTLARGPSTALMTSATVIWR